MTTEHQNSKIPTVPASFSDLEIDEYAKLQKLIAEHKSARTGCLGLAKLLISPRSEIKSREQRVKEISAAAHTPVDVTQHALNAADYLYMTHPNAAAAMTTFQDKYQQSLMSTLRTVDPYLDEVSHKTIRLTTLSTGIYFSKRR